jgi:hypothetical protein
MRVAKPLFEPNHGFPAHGKAEVPWFYDPGVDRADRNLMEIISVNR